MLLCICSKEAMSLIPVSLPGFPPESKAKIKGSCIASLLWKVIPGNSGKGLKRLSRKGERASTKMYWADHQLSIEVPSYWDFLKSHAEFSSELCIWEIMEDDNNYAWLSSSITPGFTPVRVPSLRYSTQNQEVRDKKRDIPRAAEATCSQVTAVKVVLTVTTGVK